jgi:ATP-dependent phosphofructokinase / diphosphate-dependent phosphofructokinase
MDRLKGKVLIAQGGGPTAVINQTLAGVVLEARKNALTTAVYGSLNGVRGIVEENLLDLTWETSHNLERIASTSSSALLSTRDKPDQEYCSRIFDVMRKHDIRYFFYIGGNDSADTVRIIEEQARSTGYDLRTVHIPKTIDNDLPVNDHCPGFGSAARFVTQAFMGLNLDSRALPGVLMGIVMGRHSGFLTASSILAKKYSDEGPHLIYLPERPFSLESFLTDVGRVYGEHGRCVIAVAEGIKDANGDSLLLRHNQNHEQDAHGNWQLSGTGILGDFLAKTIRDNLHVNRVRADTFGYLQRCFTGVISDRDSQEARELGEIAVHYAMEENRNGSVVIRRPVMDYSVSYDLVNLPDVAGKTRVMSDDFINEQGNGVTDLFRAYCSPLVGTQLPESFRLRAPSVPKILEPQP